MSSTSIHHISLFVRGDRILSYCSVIHCVRNLCIGDHHVILWIPRMVWEPMNMVSGDFLSEIEDLLVRISCTGTEINFFLLYCTYIFHVTPT